MTARNAKEKSGAAPGLSKVEKNSRRGVKNLNKFGVPPGTLVYTGTADHGHDVSLRLMKFDEAEFSEERLESAAAVEKLQRGKHGQVTWVDVDGVHDPAIVEKVGIAFNIHPLVLEDVMNVTQRPKIDDFGSYIFIVARMIYVMEDTGRISTEQVSIVLGSDFIITFQEDPGDVWDGLRNDLRRNKGKARKHGAAFLLYNILDAIVENYFKIIDQLAERIDDLEERVLSSPDESDLATIRSLKQDMIMMRRAVFPLRDIMDFLETEESSVKTEDADMYFRNLYDHVTQIMDQVETYRDITGALIDIYLSSMNNNVDSIMKRLTLITAIFMPLTLLTAIGGMSEWSMMTGPGNWPISYPAFLGLLCIVALAMFLFLKKRGWA